MGSGMARGILGRSKGNGISGTREVGGAGQAAVAGGGCSTAANCG